MRALFETMPLAPGQDLLLLYRARRADDVIFGPELDAIAAHRDARVDRDVYLCGSPGLAKAVRQALRAAGLPDGQLHEERFDF